MTSASQETTVSYSTDFPNSTAITSTPNTDLENTTTTTDTTGPDNYIAYITVTAISVALVEFLIIILLISRYCCATNKKGDKDQLKDQCNGEVSENQVFAVVNQAFTGVDPRNHNTAKVDTNRSVSQTKASCEFRENGPQTLQRRDPGYMDIDIMTDKPVVSEKGCGRSKNIGTEFINKTYSHIETKSHVSPMIDHSTYSQVQYNGDEHSFNSLTTGIQGKEGKLNTETEGDTEYDHAVYRKSYHTFEDNKTYSRLSSSAPRKNPFLRLMEEIDITDTQYEDTVLMEAGSTRTETLKKSFKQETAKKDTELLETPDRQYTYTKVKKDSKREKCFQKPATVQPGKQTRQREGNLVSYKPDESCGNEAHDKDRSVAEVAAGTPKNKYQYSEVKKGSKSLGKEPKLDNERTNKMAVQKEEKPPIIKKPDRSYTYSKAVKKTENTREVSKMNDKDSHLDRDNKKSFIVTEDQDLGDHTLSKRHEYINITRQNTV